MAKPKVGITFSAFDLFHAGHVAMLQEAKQHCDRLIVCLQTDPTIDRPTKNKPVQSVFERYVQVSGCKFVDEVIPYETEKDVIDILTVYRPDIRFIGEEYRTTEFTGRQICSELGIELYFNSRKHSFSTSELRGRVTEKSLPAKKAAEPLTSPLITNYHDVYATDSALTNIPLVMAAGSITGKGVITGQEMSA
jgi:glycerol-3-phosphate cytidylyltransferase